METHTYELRLNKHDFKKEPSFWTETLYKGNSYEECKRELSEICKKIGYNENCNLALSNGGYRIVDLAEERIHRIKEHGVELFNALEDCIETLEAYKIDCKGLSLGKKAINKALGNEKS